MLAHVCHILVDRALADLNAYLAQSSRMRCAPQVAFSLAARTAAIRLIKATTSSVSGGLPYLDRDLDLRLQ